MLTSDALRMELDSMSRGRFMAHRHDQSTGPCIGHQRRTRLADRQRVITRRGERGGQSAKQAAAVMIHARDLAMHWWNSVHLVSAGDRQRLMPQAHPEERNPPLDAGRREVNRDSRLLGPSRAG